MKHYIGNFLYSKNTKYDNGKITDYKRNKYFITTNTEIVEIDETELENNFYWNVNG